MVITVIVMMIISGQELNAMKRVDLKRLMRSW